MSGNVHVACLKRAQFIDGIDDGATGGFGGGAVPPVDYHGTEAERDK